MIATSKPADSQLKFEELLRQHRRQAFLIALPWLILATASGAVLVGTAPFPQPAMIYGLAAFAILLVCLWLWVLKKPHVVDTASMLLIGMLSFIVLFRLNTLLGIATTELPTDQTVFRPIWSFVTIIFFAAAAFLDEKRSMFFSLTTFFSVIAVTAYHTLPIIENDPSRPGILEIWMVVGIVYPLLLIFTLAINRFRTASQLADRELDMARANLALMDELQVNEQKLDAAYRDMERFAADAAHDLKEPLRTMAMFAGMIKMKTEQSEDQQLEQFANRIVAKSEQMSELIDALMKLAKLDKDLPPAASISLHEIVSDARKRLDGMVRERGVRIEVELKAETIFGHQDLLTTAVQNLINNGIKFQPGSAPRIDITSEQIGGEIFLHIQDHGIGIEEKYIQQITEPFQRLHSKDDYPGSGLGLATVSRIMQIEGGRLEIESELEKGSRFSLVFACKE